MIKREINCKMKTFKYMTLLFATMFGTCCANEDFPMFYPGDSKYYSEDSTVTPEPVSPAVTEPDWSLLTSNNHPRVIFTDADFADIPEKLSSNPVLKTIHDKIISKAITSLTASELERTLSGKRLLSVSRDAEERILACAYAYKTTGEEKYLTRAEHDISTVCNFSDWNAKQHFLDVGEMAAGVGLAYDWLYNELGADTKTLVQTKLDEFAFTPANDGVWNLNFYESTGNWNQVCNGGLVCAALAVYESDQTTAKGIIEKAMETNISAMSEMYSPDGNYPEGYSYWCYGTLYEALMLTAMETATGSDTGLSQTDGFSSTGKYMLHMEGPLKMCFNYSDCASSSIPCLAQWYFAYKFNDKSLLYLEKDRLSSYGSSSESRLLTLIAYYALKMQITSLDDIPAPEDYFFRGEGPTPVVLIHDNWKMDINDKFLGIKGGKASTSHGHMDAGSFVYDAFGVRWSADLGLQSYGTLEPYINLWDMNDGSERWTSFRYNNFNHSTLTINDSYHKASGEAKITGLVNANGKKGATIDMTGPLSNEVESASRSIYMEGNKLYIVDDITAKDTKDAKVRWTLVSRAEPTYEYGKMTLESTSGKIMYLTAATAKGKKPSMKTWSTVSANSWDASNSGYYECGYEITVTKGTSETITSILSPE